MERIEFTMQAAPPFRLDLTVWALRRRPNNLVDRWDGRTYRRVLALDGVPIDVEVRQSGPPELGRLRVTATAPYRPAAARRAIAACLDRMLGLRLDLAGFYRLAARDRKLHALATRFLGLKPPRFPSVFEALVNGIACQQVSLEVGLLLLNRLAGRYGLRMDLDGSRAHAFPRPPDLAGRRLESLRALGFSSQKSLAVVEIARAIARGHLDLEVLDPQDDAALATRLRQLRGVGPWTADYVLLRGYGRIDVFPVDDVGGRNNLRRWRRLPRPLGPDGARRLLAKWRPYRGLIYFHLLLDSLARDGALAGDSRGPEPQATPSA